MLCTPLFVFAKVETGVNGGWLSGVSMCHYAHTIYADVVVFLLSPSSSSSSGCNRAERDARCLAASMTVQAGKGDYICGPSPSSYIHFFVLPLICCFRRKKGSDGDHFVPWKRSKERQDCCSLPSKCLYNSHPLVVSEFLSYFFLYPVPWNTWVGRHFASIVKSPLLISQVWKVSPPWQ